MLSRDQQALLGLILGYNSVEFVFTVRSSVEGLSRLFTQCLINYLYYCLTYSRLPLMP